MKQIYFFAFLLVALLSNSQTITQSFHEPVTGDVDKNYKLDTSAYVSGLPIHNTGSNCVWDFTDLVSIFPMIIDSFISPAAATGGSAYPTATYAQHRDVLFTFYKSTSSPQQTELLGAYSPSLAFTFTNSAIIASYPVNYGYNLSDPVSGSFKYGTTNGACNGNITISADASGTLICPNGASVSVLRLKSEETLTLSLGIAPFGTFNQTIYNFYTSVKKFPVVSINYTTYQYIAGTPTITALVYGSNLDFIDFVGVEKFSSDDKDCLVYPNPFHSQLFVKAKEPIEKNDYSFFAMNGSLALKTDAVSEEELAKLMPGIYFLEIRNSRGTFHQKIVKE
jgi:hypothetical protein